VANAVVGALVTIAAAGRFHRHFHLQTLASPTHRTTEEVVIIDGEQRRRQSDDSRTGPVLTFDLTHPLGAVDITRVESHAVDLVQGHDADDLVDPRPRDFAQTQTFGHDVALLHPVQR